MFYYFLYYLPSNGKQMFFFCRFIQRVVNSSNKSISTRYDLILKRKQLLTFLPLATLKRKDL